MRKNWLFWLTRVLAILFIGLISLFALDVFDLDLSLGGLLLGLFMHLIPTYALLIALFIAWRFPLPGGFLFIMLGASYFFFMKGQHWSAYLIVGGIPVLIGLLFICEHLLNKRNQSPA